MKKLMMSMVAAPLIMSSMVSVASAADDGFNILSDVKFKGEVRPRYEFKDNSGSALDAGNSFTNRTNLNIQGTLLEVDGLNATLELNAVNDLNTLDNVGQQTAGEADVAKMSQANIAYTVSGVTGIVGRKTVNLDNQRFIGSVGWKQNFQTLDLAAVAYGNDNLSVLLAYVYGVNAIGDSGYGTKGQVYNGVTASGGTSSVALNVSYKIADPIKLTAYGYLLGSVSDTYGISATGDVKLDDSMKLDYRAEFAVQKDSSLEYDNLGPKSTNVDANYYNLDVGANLSGILLGANYEVLGAGNDTAVNGSFQTPLATKHKFNGWADQFLKTPAGGLQDLNLRAGYKAKDFGKVLAVYHMFSTDEEMAGKSDLGSEFDAVYVNKIPGVSGLTGMVKAAFYSGGDVATYTDDQTMAWLMLDYKFATK